MKNKSLIISLVILAIVAGVVYFSVRKPVAEVAPAVEPVNENLIVKKEWGVSFVKDSSYQIVNNFPNYSPPASVFLLYEPVTKVGITIEYISGGTGITIAHSISDATTIRFDEKSQSWVREEIGGGKTAPAVPAETDLYTSDNLSVFTVEDGPLTYVIPLSHTSFLELSIGLQAYTGASSVNTQPLTDLVKTLKKL